MKTTFTSRIGTKVFYISEGVSEFTEFVTSKLETDNGLIIDACTRHPKVFLVGDLQEATPKESLEVEECSTNPALEEVTEESSSTEEVEEQLFEEEAIPVGEETVDLDLDVLSVSELKALAKTYSSVDLEKLKSLKKKVELKEYINTL